MVSRMIYMPTVAASMAYANSNTEPKVSQASGTEFQGSAKSWAYVDFGVGFAVGMYNDFISHAYDDDCQA